MPEVVISNTSPIFYLHRLRLLDLLRELYQKIVVPKAVVAELETGRRQGEDVPEIDSYEWIETRTIQSPHNILFLKGYEIIRSLLFFRHVCVKMTGRLVPLSRGRPCFLRVRAFLWKIRR